MKRTKQNRKKGMTLIEILIVVAIIVTLMGILATNLASSREGANIKMTKVAMGQIKGAIDRFELDANHIPSSSEGIQALVSGQGIKGWHGPYLEAGQTKDPWGTEYTYENVSRKEFRIISAGPDTQFGNEDDITYPETESDAPAKEGE